MANRYRELLRDARGQLERALIPDAQLEAEYLLAHACLCSRQQLRLGHLSQAHGSPTKPQELCFLELLALRTRRRVPLAQLLQSWDFYGLELEINADVLIPRPETEELVELSLSLPLPPAARIVDVGTGSGAIAIAIATQRPESRLWATDLSQAALNVARRNAQRHGLDARIKFHHGDLLAPLPPECSSLALVISNPPYIAADEASTLAPELAHEPTLALFAGEQGLALVRRLAAAALPRLAHGAFLLCEIGHQQGQRAAALLRCAGYEDVRVLKDLSHHDRFLLGTRP
ncbi:MAG: peptide chain release factor N(5)-glutamine methyltransferase [Myxococcota bacterium]|jgi:release factor glutamine methyltransferase|nr:peptide chain release factor N(5)-glutamine methyltransferase [Myxococcota bacterium]